MGYGYITMTLPNGSVNCIHNVMYVLRINKNLIFMSTITDQNLKVKFFKTHCMVKDLLDHCKPVSLGVRVGGLYKIDITRKTHQEFSSIAISIESLWHQRYGHMNYHDLLLSQKQSMVEGIPMLKNEYTICEGCALGNIHKDEFPFNSDRRRIDLLELLHSNVCGPMQTRSLGGAYYGFVFY